MTLEEIVADAKLVLAVGKAVVDLAAEESPYLQTAYALLSGTSTLNDAQRSALRARQEALENEILAPLPPEDEPLPEDPSADPHTTNREDDPSPAA